MDSQCIFIKSKLIKLKVDDKFKIPLSIVIQCL